MKIKARSEEEISKMGLLEEGIYDFEINMADERKSKSGNEMIEIELKITLQDYTKKYIKDYLLTNDNQSMQFKLIHLFDSINMMDVYKSEDITVSVLEGAKGKVLVGIKHDPNNEYPPKNIVKDYIKKNDNRIPLNRNKLFKDDDLPF